MKKSDYTGLNIPEDEQEMYTMLAETFNERIPFNRLLQLDINHVSKDGARMKINMREELVGNFMRGNLHGGVISSCLDVIGGLVSFLGILNNNPNETMEQKMERFRNLGTIDLRVDYLRPGHGEWFYITGYLLRTGKKVAVTRMELHNNEDLLIAVGTGAYIVG